MTTAAAILLGNVTGLIVGVTITTLLLRSRISNTTIKGKVKQKRTHGSIQDVTNSISVPGSRKSKREENKKERESKRDLRKANK